MVPKPQLKSRGQMWKDLPAHGRMASSHPFLNHILILIFIPWLLTQNECDTIWCDVIIVVDMFILLYLLCAAAFYSTLLNLFKKKKNVFRNKIGLDTKKWHNLKNKPKSLPWPHSMIRKNFEKISEFFFKHKLTARKCNKLDYKLYLGTHTLF